MRFDTNYLVFDPRLKNREWIDRLISSFRMTSYYPLVDNIKGRANRDIVKSNYDVNKLKNLFKDADQLEKLGFDFVTISIMEKLKNILTAEKMKSDIMAYVDAQDPSMERLKKEDKNLLKNKNLIEGQVNILKKSIGLPPDKLNNDDFNGNYDQFQQLGLNINNNTDVETFFDFFYQLDIESYFQKVINHTFTVNSISDYTNDFLDDCIALKTLACQTYINKITGQIVIKRIDPINVFRIKGDHKTTQKGDVAIGYYEEITISEFIKRVGDTFDFARDFLYLLEGSNYYNKTSYTGIELDSDIYGEKGNVCTYNQLMSFTVQLGYIEFKSIDADVYKKFTNLTGNTKVFEYDLSEQENSDLKKDNKYEVSAAGWRERTYKAYFMSTNSNTQYSFNYGLLYHQETEGQEDEYSCYSIKYIQYDGATIAEIAKPWINLAQEAFVKLRVLIRTARPDGRAYNADSLKESAKIYYGDQGPASIKEMYQLMENGINEIYAFPRDKDNRIVPMQGGVNHDIIRNMDSKFTTFRNIVDWAVESIKRDIGINDLRSAESPKTNDVYKLETKSLEMSSNATYYIDNMFNYVYRNQAISILSFLMDIIRYKDSLPYKYVVNIIGEIGCKALEKLPKMSPHRMDIFISSFSTIKDRIKVLNDTRTAYEKGAISYATAVLIDGINDHRKAQRLLVIKEQEFINEKKQEEETRHKNAMALKKQDTDSELMIIDRKGQWEVRKAQVMAQGYENASAKNGETKSSIKNTEIQASKDKMILEKQLQDQEKY